ncbi:MAG: hypothetical protein CMN55_08095 [Sneathiella sp.]|jgi:hypothetical protein|nr:hypothetical protein [Sneathiella sp.]|tara:strand:- start:942 stop:1424 length:483 start_codon:yes stop_codon:yes gene_type:complete
MPENMLLSDIQGLLAAKGATMDPTEIQDLSVAAVFKSYPQAVRLKLLRLRWLILETARGMDGLEITETLKWGEPSYSASGKIGTPLRIAPAKTDGHYGLYVHCGTTLINEFRESYPDAFHYSGTRALLFGPDDEAPRELLEDFIRSALTYHRRKRQKSSR